MQVTLAAAPPIIVGCSPPVQKVEYGSEFELSVEGTYVAIIMCLLHLVVMPSLPSHVYSHWIPEAEVCVVLEQREAVGRNKSLSGGTQGGYGLGGRLRVRSHQQVSPCVRARVRQCENLGPDSACPVVVPCPSSTM